MREVVVVSAVRTAIGTFGGSLKDVPPTQLAALVVREAVRRAGVDPAQVGHVAFGHVINTEPRDMYLSRVAAIEGGLSQDVPAMNVNRLCGSGLQAIVSASQSILLGDADIAIGGGAEAPDSEWQRIWDINFMSHVWAARHVLPQMLARGDGYLLSTASAAGLLSSIGSAPYAVTKHAAVAFAEWLSITHGPAIKVSCLCPQGVFTNMLMHPEAGPATAALRPEAISPEEVADFVIRGLAEEKFLILPHPIVAEYVQRKATDRDRWIAGMRKIQAKILAASGGTLM